MKKVIVGVLVLLALTLVTIWVTNQDSSGTLRKELTDFRVTDTNALDSIILKDEAGKRITLERNGANWTVNKSFVARRDAISILLNTMSKLAVKAPVGEAMKSTVLKNIIAKHTLVQAYADGECIKTYYVGGPDRDHTGTFMLMKGSSRPFIMHLEGFHGFLTTRFFTNENEWSHRGVFEYEANEIKRIEVHYKEKPSNDFLIERQDDGSLAVFEGADNRPLLEVDTFMLNAYLARYQKIHFEGVEETKTQGFLDSVLLKEPFFTINLTDMQGAITEVEAYLKPLPDGYDLEGNPIENDLDRFYLRINKQNLVVAQYAIFDKLTKRIGFLENR
jgi:hypothetical protein